MMVSAKSQIDSITGGASVTEVKDNVVGAAGQTLNSMEKVVGGAAPVAKETLQTAQDKLGLLVGGNAAKQQGMPSWNWTSVSAEHAAADAGDSERIDQLDTEHVSDFLRESHMSTKAPPSKK